MKKIFTWSEWSIATKILILFLGLSIVSMGIVGYFTNANTRNLGNYTIDSSIALGQRAINDSTSHLKTLGEDIINQKSGDVAKQVGMYLANYPEMSIEEMRTDGILRSIVVQAVGKTGYTTLIDPEAAIIIIHKFPGQEKNLAPLEKILPTFWSLLKSSVGIESTSGYYDWLEVDGSISQKYAGIHNINTSLGPLSLWATTYINEFSLPAEQTKEDIIKAIDDSSRRINKYVDDTQNGFFIIFGTLVIVVIGISLLLSRVITRPIQALKVGAEEIGKGNLDYNLNIKSKDELGDLEDSFNNMAAELKKYTEQLKSTAAENLEKEKKIQENLRLYFKKVGQAQEAERKRIARELHDDTIQALVVVSRKLDDLFAGNSGLKTKDIRDEIRRIIEGIRHFSQELRPSILDDLGLIPSVKWLASNFENNYKISVEVEVTGSQHPLLQESELMLFRIIQEGLNNVGKHSRASRVSVKLEYFEKSVKVVISDNGQGFNVPSKVSDLARIGKLGLLGIMERARVLGGNLNIESQPGKGTTLVVEVPYTFE